MLMLILSSLLDSRLLLQFTSGSLIVFQMRLKPLWKKSRIRQSGWLSIARQKVRGQFGFLLAGIKEVGAWWAACWPFFAAWDQRLWLWESTCDSRTVTWRQGLFCLPAFGNGHLSCFCLVFLVRYFPQQIGANTLLLFPHKWSQFSSSFNIESAPSCGDRGRVMLSAAVEGAFWIWTSRPVWRWKVEGHVPVSRVSPRLVEQSVLTTPEWKQAERRSRLGRRRLRKVYFFILTHFLTLSASLQREAARQPRLDPSVTGECCRDDM